MGVDVTPDRLSTDPDADSDPYPRSMSAGCCPASCCCAPLGSVLCVCFPFGDHGKTAMHLDHVKGVFSNNGGECVVKATITTRSSAHASSPLSSTYLGPPPLSHSQPTNGLTTHQPQPPAPVGHLEVLNFGESRDHSVSPRHTIIDRVWGESPQTPVKPPQEGTNFDGAVAES